jgi:hypothetical protein
MKKDNAYEVVVVDVGATAENEVGSIEAGYSVNSQNHVNRSDIILTEV